MLTFRQKLLIANYNPCIPVNDTRDLVDLPKGSKVNRCKWVFRKKQKLMEDR